MRVVLLRHGKTEGNEAHRYVGRTDEGLTEAARETILKSREDFWRDVLRLPLPAEAGAAGDASAEAPAGTIGNLTMQNVGGSNGATSLPDLTLWVSPMRRARETAALLCPGIPQRLVPDFREMDFGRFEYRNYQELMADPDSAGIYQRFIDSGGTGGFPEGESRAAFSERVCRAYAALLPEIFVNVVQEEDHWMAFGETAGEKPMPKQRDAEKTLLIAAHGGTMMALLERFGRPKRDYFDWQCACLGGFSGELAMDGSISGLTAFRLGDSAS